jgi:hypothetical protein
MKRLGLIFALGIGLTSCRQASFIAEDDVYSPSTGYVASGDNSDASYSTYVYSQQGSGTKSAYYNPDETSQQEESTNATRQQGTQGSTVVNNYYGYDPIYANGWHGYGAFGYPYGGYYHNPWRYSYRSRWVWYGWGYDPFFYGFYSPWNSWCGYGAGWGYGWGYNPYMYGYNPYAWGYGYGYNPYGYGGWGHNPYGWGGGNTIIYGNVYNIYGNQGIATSGNLTGSGLIQSGNTFVGHRPSNATHTTPYSGINKTKTALDVNGKPKEVKNITAMRESSDNIRPVKNTGTLTKNEPMQASAGRQITSQQLTGTSKPWTPETIGQSAGKPSVDGPRNIGQPTTRPVDQTNRPVVPNKPAVEQPSRPATNQSVSPSRPSTQPKVEPTRPQTNPNNQWNRNTTPQNRGVSPNPSPRPQMSAPQNRPSGGSFDNSPSRMGGGSIGSPSRSGGSMGGSFGGGSSPRSGGSIGGGSRGGRP